MGLVRGNGEREEEGRGKERGRKGNQKVSKWALS